MWSKLLLLFLTIGLVTADCDRDACNIGLSSAYGISGTCAAIGAFLCPITGGFGCGVALACGSAAAVSLAGRVGCEHCGQQGGEISGDEMRDMIGQVLEQDNVTRELIIRGVLEQHNVTRDWITRSTQKIMDSVKEVNENVQQLANQMNRVKIDLSRLISIGALQVSYLKDLQHFDLFAQRYEELDRDSSGLIVNNRKVDEFKRVINHDFDGAERTYLHFHTMAVGGRIFRQKSIFEIDSTYCSAKDYILYVMQRLFEFDATAKGMEGRAIDPAKIEQFKHMYIDVAQKHIEVCGCPVGPAVQMKNLQSLLSQPAHSTSGIKFYDAMISSTSVDRIADVKKLNLLYKAKPFNYFSKSILKAIRSQPIEVPELILHLAKHDSLNIIPYLENKLICTKGYVREVAIKTGNIKYAQSDCAADLEICDAQGNCCKTSDLNNPWNDRESGNTDPYTEQTILGSCAKEGLHGDPKTAKLTVGGGNLATNAWYVEWIQLRMSSGGLFECPVNGWLEKEANSKWPSTRVVDCQQSGRWFPSFQH